jgi:hypothetical protein
MNDKQKNEIGPETFFSDWMKTSTAFWESMASMWPDLNTAGDVTPDSNRDEKPAGFRNHGKAPKKPGKHGHRLSLNRKP